jgi:hypothetical protein
MLKEAVELSITKSKDSFNIFLILFTLNDYRPGEDFFLNVRVGDHLFLAGDAVLQDEYTVLVQDNLGFQLLGPGIKRVKICRGH